MPKYKYRKKKLGVSKKTAVAVRKIVHDVNKREEEMKAFFNSYQWQVRDNGTVQYLNQISQGVDSSDRVGLQIAPKSLYICYTVANSFIHPNGANPLTSHQMFRVLIWRDMQYDGSNQLAIGDVLEGADTRAPLNANWVETPRRVQLLYDRLHNLGTTGLTVTTATPTTYVPYMGEGTQRIHTVKKTIKLAGKIKFVGTTNLDAAGGQGSLFLGLLSNVATAAAGTVNRVDFYYRLIYSDA